MAGYIYDASAEKRLQDFVNKQEEEFSKIDKEQYDKKLIQYAIVVGGVAVSILILGLVFKKKK
jgi:hypothetical protein